MTTPTVIGKKRISAQAGLKDQLTLIEEALREEAEEHDKLRHKTGEMEDLWHQQFKKMQMKILGAQKENMALRSHLTS